jgi:hypothetical protein
MYVTGCGGSASSGRTARMFQNTRKRPLQSAVQSVLHAFLKQQPWWNQLAAGWAGRRSACSCTVGVCDETQTVVSLRFTAAGVTCMYASAGV